MTREGIELIGANLELEKPFNGNVLGGTFSYFSKKNPTSERKNQDSIGLYSRDKKAIIIVADGIGGHRMGDEASKIAVSTIINSCKKQENISFIEIYNAILQANKNIRSLNVGAGTTLCLGFIDDNLLTFISTGDSKGIHLSGKGNVKNQTVDQSSAGLANLSELFSENDVSNKSGGNQLVFALGDETLQLTISSPIELNQRDNVLIASDGLTANLSTSEIAQIITTGPVNERVSKLVEQTDHKMTKISGHPDDLSIFLLSFGRSDSTEDPVEEAKKA